MNNFRRRVGKTSTNVPTATGIYLLKESGAFVSPTQSSGNDPEWSLHQWAIAQANNTEAIVLVQNGRYYAMALFPINGRIAMQPLNTDIARSTSDGMANTTALIADSVSSDDTYPALIANRIDEMNNNNASNVRGGYPITWYIPAFDEFKALFTGALAQDFLTIYHGITNSWIEMTNFGTSTLVNRYSGKMYRGQDDYENTYQITSDIDFPLFFQFE